MAGWIKISRNIIHHWIWNDAERLKWWLDLLIMASWENKKQVVGRQLITLKMGQLIASVPYLCKRWNRSRTMVEPFLNLLISDGMIEKSVNKNISIITIKNYAKYQAQDSAYLDADINDSNSVSCEQQDADINAHLDAHADTHLDTHLDAYLDAPNKEYKESKEYNNIQSTSLHSVDCSSSSQKNDAPFNYNELMLFFNKKIDEQKSSIKKIKSIEGKRRDAVRARIKQYGKKDFAKAIDNLVSSPFLNGDNNRQFTATFDWFVRPNVFPKVLEGNYNKIKNGNDRQRDKERRASDVARQVEELLFAEE